MSPLPVAVLAGGLGTRMAQRTGPVMQKALLGVAGRPFIDFKLAQLAYLGAEDVVLLVGHGGQAIRDHVGDGDRFGLRVRCLFDGDSLLGTGGAVRRAVPLLGDRFWVTYGDSLVAVPLADAEEALDRSGLPGAMVVLRNRDAWDASNVRLEGGLIAEYRKGTPPGSFEYIDYGMMLLPGSAFLAHPEGTAFDLAGVLQRLVSRRQLLAIQAQERFFEIGSEAGFRVTEAYLTQSRAWDRWTSPRD